MEGISSLRAVAYGQRAFSTSAVDGIVDDRLFQGPATPSPPHTAFLQLCPSCPSLLAVKPEPTPEFEIVEGRCAGPQVCPLSRVQAGATVCIKRLFTAPDVSDRLRELGFCEEQRIKLLARQSSYICQVCNARLAISGKLAESIMVEPVSALAAEA